jgi:hypothetical protein
VNVQVGAISYSLSTDTFLSPAAAQWATERLWALVSGGASWLGQGAAIHVPLVRPDEVAEVYAAAAGTGRWLKVGREASGVHVPDVFAPPVLASDVTDATDWARPWDLITFTFLCLSRWEERSNVDGVRDSRGRFPAERSLAAKHGFLHRPVIDEWALVLRAWLETRSSWRATSSSFRVFLTSDIDSVRKFGSLRTVARSVGADVLRNRAAAPSTLRAGIKALRSEAADPHVAGVHRLMDVAERYGHRAAFYFKTAVKSPHDSGYDLAQTPARSLVSAVRARDHEIGFHPGYRTVDDFIEFDAEWQRFQEAVGPTVAVGGRQHNLRFHVPETWRRWSEAGLTYDSSMGFAETAGFRCSTCQPYPVFDIERDRELPILERPLVVMDTTLSSPRYEGLDRDAATRRITSLATSCRRVNGEFVLLWHNSSFEGAYAGWGDVLETALAEISTWGTL